jgi:hypothetical protein
MTRDDQPPTLDRFGRRIGRIGDGYPTRECLDNYARLYPDRVRGWSRGLELVSRYPRGTSLGYRFSSDITGDHTWT